MAEDEGFEPPQTESESGVLPLHKPSKLRSVPKHVSYYIQKKGKVKHYFYKSPNISGTVAFPAAL